MAICKLCLKDRDLRNSHIIPEFMYEPIYDEKHRLHEISTDPNVTNKQNRQKGYREKLLCQECEAKLSNCERYVSMVWRGGVEVKFKTNGRFTKMSLLDYSKFKLFAISILWRASVASGELFNTVNLGSKHESRLRKMILDGDPGEPHEYGCAILPLISDDLKGKTVEAILSPDRIRLEGHTAYRFLFGSAIWIFIVSSHSSSFPRMEFLLSKEGSILMAVIKAEETELFTRLASELRNQGKLEGTSN